MLRFPSQGMGHHHKPIRVGPSNPWPGNSHRERRISGSTTNSRHIHTTSTKLPSITTTTNDRSPRNSDARANATTQCTLETPSGTLLHMDALAQIKNRVGRMVSYPCRAQNTQLQPRHCNTTSCAAHPLTLINPTTETPQLPWVANPRCLKKIPTDLQCQSNNHC